MSLVLLISLLPIVTCFNNVLLSKEENIERPGFSTCLREIYDAHQNFYKLTIVVYSDGTIDNFPENVFTETNSFVTTNNITELNQTSEFDEGTILIVIYFKSCDKMADLDITTFDITFKYVVIIDTDLDKTCNEDVERKLYEFDRYDLVFLTADIRKVKYDLITAIPEINAKSCNISKTIKFINACQNGSLINKKISNLFPTKELTDLKMCNFNVGMATLYPYAKVDNEHLLKDLDTEVNLYGTDVEIMKIIADVYNSSLKLFYIYRDKQNPYIFQQLVKYLINGTLDACAGGLYRVYGDQVAYSNIYSRQTIFWVFTVERERRSWQSFVVKMTGIHVFMIIYACYVILWNIIDQFDHQCTSVFNTIVYAWGALVGAAGLQDARSLKQKILNVSYLITCLHLSAYVSTQIYYYLTVEGPPHSFRTIDELKLSDRIPYLIPSSKYFVDDNKHRAYVNKSRDCTSFSNCEELMLKNKASTILVEGLLPRLQAASSINDEAGVMRVPEDIIVIYHEMIMNKRSPLVKIFQKSIQRLFEAGICQKLYDEAIGITVVDKAKIANKNILSNSYSCTLGCEITLAQSAIIFYIWVFGCSLSCCIFVIEILLKAPTSLKAADSSIE